MTQKCQKRMKYTLATHAIEKLTPSKEALHLCQRMERKELSADAAVAFILAQYGLK